MWTAHALERVLEKIDIDEHVRDRVLVHHRDIPPGEKILWGECECQSSKPLDWTGLDWDSLRERHTHDEAVCDVRHGALVRLVLVCVLDDEGVDDGGEPVDELVQVHARGVLARLGRPVVL